MGTALVHPYDPNSTIRIQNYSSQAMEANTACEVGSRDRRTGLDEALTIIGNIPATISKKADRLTNRQFTSISATLIGIFGTIFTPIKIVLAALHTLFQGAKAVIYKPVSFLGRNSDKASEAFTRFKAGLVNVARGCVQSIPVIGHMVMNGLDRIYDIAHKKLSTTSTSTS